MKGRQEAAAESVIRFEERMATFDRDIADLKREIQTLEQQMAFRRSDLAVLAAYHKGAPLAADIDPPSRGGHPP